MERMHRPKPSQPFSQVMAKKAADAPPPEPTKKQQKLEALPKKGPRPQLAHPAQRDAFGREETKAGEAVIIKG
jgi:hypothetical protein